MAVNAELGPEQPRATIRDVASELGWSESKVIARFWIESFNYFQHYGLARVEGTAISRRHVWNHLKPLSRILGFEITNHADHHTDTFAAFHQLVPDRRWIDLGRRARPYAGATCRKGAP